MSVKARRVPNVRDEIVDDWYGSIVDKEWDEYEVGSSFLVEEPYSNETTSKKVWYRLRNLLDS